MAARRLGANRTRRNHAALLVTRNTDNEVVTLRVAPVNWMVFLL
jgi:hypothetical protein